MSNGRLISLGVFFVAWIAAFNLMPSFDAFKHPYVFLVCMCVALTAARVDAAFKRDEEHEKELEQRDRINALSGRNRIKPL